MPTSNAPTLLRPTGSLPEELCNSPTTTAPGHSPKLGPPIPRLRPTTTPARRRMRSQPIPHRRGQDTTRARRMRGGGRGGSDRPPRHDARAEDAASVRARTRLWPKTRRARRGCGVESTCIGVNCTDARAPEDARAPDGPEGSRDTGAHPAHSPAHSATRRSPSLCYDSSSSINTASRVATQPALT